MTERYTHDEMACVMSHIERYFGTVTKILHEKYSPDVHIDVCVIPPRKGKPFWTLVTLGMGAHRMNVPEELREVKLDRAELVIALPEEWKIESPEENWYWPIRLLKDLARLPGSMDTWLGWGHSVDNPKPYASNTQLSAAMLIMPQGVEDEANVCVLPDGDEVNFYHVVPIYKEESAFLTKEGADALLDRLRSFSWIANPERPNLFTDYVPNQILDDAEWHWTSIREKNLPIDEINGFNHLAIFLRWSIEHRMMSAGFVRRYPEAVANPTDLRAFIRDELDGKLLRSMFGDEGFQFVRYYYGDNDQAPYYPCDVDDYAFRWFGSERYFSDEFQDEAYLFVPFDETYYQGLSKVIDQRWAAWQNIQANPADWEPTAVTEAIIRFLDCDCEIFPPMPDDDALRAAYAYAVRNGMRDGFVPVFVDADDETLLEALIANTESEEPADGSAKEDRSGDKPFAFDLTKVQQYRKRMTKAKLPAASKVLKGLLDERREEAEDDGLDWREDILGEMADGEVLDHTLWWDYETKFTRPMILAKIPVANPWEVFAWVPFGGWNECPDTTPLMAVAKHWFETCGAVPSAISHDELEMTLPDPVPAERAMRVAEEIYGFCPDLVEQADGDDTTVGHLADTLRRSPLWYFWWD